MRKQILRTVFCIVMAAAMLSTSLFSLTGSADMAYNLYANPVINGTSGRYDTYMIDFRSDMTPNGTYWALANFSLYISRDSLRKYDSLTGGGAYAGLQTTLARDEDGNYLRDGNGSLYYCKSGILSFWEMRYRIKRDEVIMTATRQYPVGSSTFTGEGDGTNCILPYQWEDNQWYRMVLHCWEDAETGTTMIGEWYMDVATGKWTLFSYFDTHLIGSAMQGGMGLFQENFTSSTKDEVRTFNTKNLYIQDHENKEWKSLDTVRISYGDGGRADKVGQHEFGATDEYFWGKSGGTVDDQSAYDKASIREKTFKIDQPENPDFGKNSVNAPTLSVVKGEQVLSWDYEETSTPQNSYEVTVYGADGSVLYSKAATRPEVRSLVLDGVETPAIRCTLKVTDIFGGTSEAELETEAYKEAINNPPTPSETETPTETETETPEPTTSSEETGTAPATEPASPTSPSSKPENKDGSKKVFVIVGIAAGVLVVAAAVAAAVVAAAKGKKKNHKK